MYARCENCLFVPRHNYSYVDSGNVYHDVLAEGHCNYTVGLRQNGHLVNTVYLMDSHGCSTNDPAQDVYSTDGGGRFLDNQKAWFVQSQAWIKAANGGVDVPGIGFCHHPFRAWSDQAVHYGYANTATDKIKGYDKDGNQNIDSFQVIHNLENLEGYTILPGDNGCMHKTVYKTQYVDSDYTIHDASKASGFAGWFFGHEHCLNATVTWEGIKYGFGVKSSEYDEYVSGEVGGTLIKLDNNNSNASLRCLAERILVD